MDASVIFEIVKWILTLFGLLAIPIVKGLWNVVKEGKDVVDKRKRYSRDGKWTEKELRDYVVESEQFWQALSNFWKTVWKGFRKIFTKSGK